MENEIQLLEWFDRLTFFFHSENFQYLSTGVVVYIAALWLAIVIWVTRDAIHRSSNILFQILAVLLNICLPVFGLILYLIIRPEKTLLEKYHEDLEYRTLEGGEEYCFACGTTVREEYSFCPNCGEEVYHECEACQKKFNKRWQICPYCGEKKMKKKKTKKPKKTKK